MGLLLIFSLACPFAPLVFRKTLSFALVRAKVLVKPTKLHRAMPDPALIRSESDQFLRFVPVSALRTELWQRRARMVSTHRSLWGTG
jgi:hypothetical protein